ncbi:MAG: hypothetical protein JST60_06195 [Chloroflexi bacterium SZAS-1]|jgi:hypothetical protein|nr:hypothetical protein [Chloroflexi bacterium SZAS-1]HNP87070.1 hypothetical protein [Kouleothrix sp.]
MSAILLMCGLAAIGFTLFRPAAPRSQVIYVPVELTEAPPRFGCTPLIILGFILVLIISLSIFPV